MVGTAVVAATRGVNTDLGVTVGTGVLTGMVVGDRVVVVVVLVVVVARGGSWCNCYGGRSIVGSGRCRG